MTNFYTPTWRLIGAIAWASAIVATGFAFFGKEDIAISFLAVSVMAILSVLSKVVYEVSEK